MCKPFLSNTDQELILSKFLQSIFTDNEQSDFISKIFSNNSLMAKEACHLLKQEFLNCNSKLFSNKSEGIKPQVGDVVLVLKEEPKLGIITEVLSSHRVTVRHKHYGTNHEVGYHSRILSLLYRPISSAFFVNLVENSYSGHIDSLGHLLPGFWNRLKNNTSEDNDKGLHRAVATFPVQH